MVNTKEPRLEKATETIEYASASGNGEERLTEDKWQAIIHNDASCDHRFFYAVETTGIFCRPSCKSRPPKRENIRIF
jgi:AraC family transcriptional regulator of adaptative response / methylphosphotriester-DNA alkyltransferase methyltransferase